MLPTWPQAVLESVLTQIRQIISMNKTNTFCTPRLPLGAGSPRFPDASLVKARWGRDGGLGGRGTPPAPARGPPSPKQATDSVDRPCAGTAYFRPASGPDAAASASASCTRSRASAHCASGLTAVPLSLAASTCRRISVKRGPGRRPRAMRSEPPMSAFSLRHWVM